MENTTMANGHSVLRLTYTINATLGVIATLTLNSFLIFLVLKRTSPEIRVYSRILLQTCLVDIYVSVSHYFTQPIYTSYKGTSYTFNNGIVSRGSLLVNFIGFLLAFPALHFSFSSLSVQFVYRYLIMCKKMDVSMTRYMCMLAVVALADGIMASTIVFGAMPKEGVNDKIYNGDPLFPLFREAGHDDYVQLCLYGEGHSSGWMLFMGSLLIIEVASYIVIGVCACKIRNHIRVAYAGTELANTRALEVNRQITLTMMLQASFPVLSMSILFFMDVTSMALKLDLLGAYVMAYSDVPFLWLPVANPLVTIAVIKPFRTAAVEFLNDLVDGGPIVGQGSMTGATPIRMGRRETAASGTPNFVANKQTHKNVAFVVEGKQFRRTSEKAIGLTIIDG